MLCRRAEDRTKKSKAMIQRSEQTTLNGSGDQSVNAIGQMFAHRR